MKLKKIIILAVLTLTCLVAVPVLADPFGLDDTANASGLAGYGTNIPVMIGNILGSILGLVAVIFFALMLYGGVLWMTARGDDSQTKKATGTITAAIIGIMIVLASYAITSFVFNSIGQPGTVASGALGGGSGAGAGTGAGGTGAGSAGAGTGTPSPTTCAQKGVEFSCEAVNDCLPNTGVSGFSDCPTDKVCCKKFQGIPGLQDACVGAGGRCATEADRKTWEEKTADACSTSGQVCLKTRSACKTGTKATADCCAGQDCCGQVMGTEYSCQNTGSKTCEATITNLCRGSNSGSLTCAKGCKDSTGGGPTSGGECAPSDASGKTKEALCASVTTECKNKKNTLEDQKNCCKAYFCTPITDGVNLTNCTGTTNTLVNYCKSLGVSKCAQSNGYCK